MWTLRGSAKLRQKALGRAGVGDVSKYELWDFSLRLYDIKVRYNVGN